MSYTLARSCRASPEQQIDAAAGVPFRWEDDHTCNEQHPCTGGVCRSNGPASRGPQPQLSSKSARLQRDIRVVSLLACVRRSSDVSQTAWPRIESR